MQQLQKRIDYTFRDPELLANALTSPACRMDRPQVKDNQRLEFLGDAIFGLLAADALYAAYPNEQEGPLTVRRTHLVSGAVLAQAAERIGLRRCLKRNKGAAPLPACAKPLADALEALMGAVWLDGGMAAAQHLFARLELPVSGDLDEWRANPKGYLQVKAQAMRPPRKPIYTIEAVKGPDHAPIVTMTATVVGLGSATATARSKATAEVAAATALLEKLQATSKKRKEGSNDK